MWSWIKRKFVACKDFVFHPIQRKLSDDWDDLTLTYVDNFIEKIGVTGVLIFYATLILCVITGVIGWMGVLPVAKVWLQYFIYCIGIPNFGILLGLVGASKYISKYKREHGWDAVYWTVSRARLFSSICMKITIVMLALYAGMVGFIALGYFAPSIFVGEALTFFVTMGLLVKGVFFDTFATGMAVIPWANLFVLRFKDRLVQADNVEMMNRRGREDTSINRGSMVDWANEDDILDCRLERLGL